MPKREIVDLIARHLLEPTLKDIYVEGESDKIFLENYIDKKGLSYNVYTIESVDMSPYYVHGVQFGNKQKVEKLSIIFEEEMGPRESCIFCITDKDFDILIDSKVSSSYLLNTDYSCLESYFYSESCVSKLLKYMFHSAAPDPKKVIADITPILMHQYIMRYAKSVLNDQWNLVDIAKVFDVDKYKNIVFDVSVYFSKFSSGNKDFNARKDEVMSFYEDTVMKTSSLDFREVMHGHDSATILNRYLNKMGCVRVADEYFEKVLLMVVEASDLDDFTLFRTIFHCSAAA